MSRLSEQKLVCQVCEKTRSLPVCCGRTMEIDKSLFFCPTCGNEKKLPVCCKKEMRVQTTVVDIKKEIFGIL
jgi:hypothetical protein